MPQDLVCQRCKHAWHYTGDKQWPQMAQCPNCAVKVKLPNPNKAKPVIGEDKVDAFVTATIETLKDQGLTSKEIRALFASKLKDKKGESSIKKS